MPVCCPNTHAFVQAHGGTGGVQAHLYGAQRHVLGNSGSTMMVAHTSVCRAPSITSAQKLVLPGGEKIRVCGVGAGGVAGAGRRWHAARAQQGRASRPPWAVRGDKHPRSSPPASPRASARAHTASERGPQSLAANGMPASAAPPTARRLLLGARPTFPSRRRRPGEAAVGIQRNLAVTRRQRHRDVHDRQRPRAAAVGE